MLPILSKALAALGGPAVLHHGGAPILAHLDLLAELPSVVAFVLDEADSLPQARRILGSQAVLLTGPQASRWPGLTPEAVETECGRLLADRHDDPRFILCNSGPDVPWQTPFDNLHALRRVVESSAEAPR
jgi:uroporphyrinogen-III decarboxylase